MSRVAVSGGVAAAAVAAAAGFHGKVPSRGDFVRRGLPGGFVEPWDRWLQAGIAQSRAQLADEWLAIYLTSPIWRFVLAPGACGERAVAGVLMPSVDRVGRYFPLTLAASLPPGRPALLALAGEPAAPWFDGAEELARRALEDDLDLDALADGVAALGAPEAFSAAAWSTSGPPAGAFDRGWRVALQGDGGRADPAAVVAAADGLLERACEAASAWWTRGSERVTPSLVLCAGLPRPDGFAALLDGRWDRWGWGELPPAAIGAPA